MSNPRQTPKREIPKAAVEAVKEVTYVDNNRLNQGEWIYLTPIKHLLNDLHKDVLDYSSKSRSVKSGHLLINKQVLLNLFEKWEEEYKELDEAINGQRVVDIANATAYAEAEQRWEQTMYRLLGEDGIGSVEKKIQELKDTIRQQEAHIKRLEFTLINTIKNLEQ